MKITLSDEDSAKLGCGATLEYDENRLSLQEAIALQKVTGYTPTELSGALLGRPLSDEKGQPLWEIDPASGEEWRDEFGLRRRQRGVDAVALGAVVWLAVRRAGVQIPFDALDVDLFAVQFGEPEVEADGPKDSPKPGTSSTRSRSTGRSSRRS